MFQTSLLTLFIFLWSPFSSAEEVTTSQTLSMEQESSEKKMNWGFGSDFLSGYSTNVAQFEGAPSGSFLDIAPNIFWTQPLTSWWDLEISGDFFYRTFSDDKVDELFRTFVSSGVLRNTFSFPSNYYWGVSTHLSQFDGREIDFTTPDQSGRDSRFITYGFSTFLGKEWDSLFTELELKRELVRAQTTVIDEQGNQFVINSNQTSGELRFGKQFSPELSLELAYNVKYIEFTDQRARLINGAVDPNFVNADRLDEFEQGGVTSLQVYNAILEGGYSYAEDQASGANTRQSAFASFSLPIEYWNFMLVRPETGIRYTSYRNYIGQIFIDPTATEKRRDQFSYYGAELVFDLGIVKPMVLGRHSSLDSNFTIIEFEEDLLTGGFRVVF